MRFHIGPVPETPWQDGEETWRPIREPGPVLFQVLALPLAFGVLFVLAVIWWRLPLQEINVVIAGWKDALAALGLMAAVIGVHELLHALVMPGGWKSNEVIIGFWPQRLLFYAHYTGAMSRNRFLAVMITPFLVLSLGPIGLVWVLAAMGGVSSWLLTVAFAVSVFNGAASCGDLLGTLLVGTQVPGDAVVRNRGWRTYWRPRQVEVPSYVER